MLSFSRNACIRLLFGILAFGAMLGCASKPTIASLNLRDSDLEQIRSVSIQYLDNGARTPELVQLKQGFIEELKRGAILRNEGTLRLGLWLVETRDRRLCLVREPPHSNVRVAFAFGLWLERKNPNWTVTGDFHEEQWFDVDF